MIIHMIKRILFVLGWMVLIFITAITMLLIHGLSPITFIIFGYNPNNASMVVAKQIVRVEESLRYLIKRD